MESMQVTVLSVVLPVAAVWDIFTRRIPNWLVVPCLLLAFIQSGVEGRIASSFSGFALAAGISGVFFMLGGMGMGDVKLLAAIGAWTGPEQTGLALTFTAFTGGVMALLWAAAHGYLRTGIDRAGDVLLNAFGAHRDIRLANPSRLSIPYAPAIAIGTWLSFLAGTNPPAS